MSELLSNTIQLHISVKVNQTWEFLVLQRSSFLQVYPKVWQVVTGRIEQGETAIETALREMTEETGIKDYDSIYTIPLVASFLDPYLDKICSVPIFGVILKDKPIIKLSNEHKDYTWLNYDESLSKLQIPSHIEGTRIFRDFILNSDDKTIFQYKKDN